MIFRTEAQGRPWGGLGEAWERPGGGLGEAWGRPGGGLGKGEQGGKHTSLGSIRRKSGVMVKWVESGDTRSLTLRGMLPAFLKGSSRLTNWPGVQERDRACVQECVCECVYAHTCTCNCIALLALQIKILYCVQCNI